MIGKMQLVTAGLIAALVAGSVSALDVNSVIDSVAHTLSQIQTFEADARVVALG